MTVRDVIYWPDNKLREPCQEVSKEELEGDDFLNLVEDMYETMQYYQGIGLAAPQIGINKRLFILSGEIIEPYDAGFYIFANPEIIETAGEDKLAIEGCLSFPDIFFPVKRPSEVTVRAITVDSDDIEHVTKKAEGLLAQAIQHEMDHLDGKLMIDYVGKVKKDMIKKKMIKFKNRLEGLKD